MAITRVSYPLTNVVGFDLERLLAKEQWIALVVDLFREQLGEDVSDDQLRAEVAARLDILYANALIPRTLPKRYERPVSR